MRLIDEILSSNNAETGKGIPIGNLTSQLFANAYLNELDQFVKRKLKRRYYIRYMDDFLNFGTDKRELRRVKDEIAVFLKEALGLALHPKKANIFPVAGGIEFLGYRVFGDYRILRKKSVARFIKRIKHYKGKIRTGGQEAGILPEAIRSWSAYAGFAESRHILNKLKKIRF